MISALKITRPMSLKFRLLSFLSQNTLSRKHDVGVLFTWAEARLPTVPQTTFFHWSEDFDKMDL